MANLYFRVQADYDKVVKLREEIERLQATLRKTDIGKNPLVGKELGNNIKAAQKEYRALTEDASKAGATIDKDFKTNIFKSSQAVNDLTGKIIKQKTVIKDVEGDIIRLSAKYNKLGRFSPNRLIVGAELGSAKRALQEEKSSLFGLQTEQAKARLSTKKLRDEYALYKEDALESAKANMTLGKSAVVIGGLAMLKQFTAQLIDIRGQFRSIEISLSTMVGEKAAKKLLAETKDYAKISPLNLKDISASTQMMIGFNIEAEKVPRYIRAIGDVSQGNSQRFNSLSLAFSQCSAAGKLMGQDLNQMINAGFNPLSMISEKTGKSIGQLKEEMSKGAISAEMVQQAFIDATSAGGKFYNMSQNASKEIAGQMSMLQDTIDNAFNEMGAKSEGVIMSGIKLTTAMVENYESLGRVLIGLVGIYGTYKTALMVNAALELGSVKAIWGKVTATRAAMLAQAAYNKVLSLNPYVMVGMAAVSLGVAMWALAERTTAAEKAQEKFNKKQEEAKNKDEERKQHLESLISTIQDETTASLDKVKAMDEIKNAYPALFQRYIDEKGHIKDLIGLWKDYNEEESKRKIQENKQNVTNTEQKIQETQEQINFLTSNGGEAGGSRPMINKLKKELIDLQEDLSLSQKQVREDSLNQLKMDLKTQADEQIKVEFDEMKRLQKERAKQPFADFSLTGNKIQDKSKPYQSQSILTGGISNSELAERMSIAQAELDSRKKPKRYIEDYEAAKKAWETAKKELTLIENDKDKFTTKQYEDAKKREYTAEKTYKDLGGKTDKELKKDDDSYEKIRKQNEKLRELTDKNAREQVRLEEDAQSVIQQSRIDAMQDGAKKTLAQRSFNHKRELDAIRREIEDKKLKVIEAAKAEFEANPTNEKKNFDADTFIKSEPAKKQFSIIEQEGSAKKESANSKYNHENDGLLKEYQDYTDKRIAIEKKFNDDIALLGEQRKEAARSGNTQQVEQIDRATAQATKHKGISLMGLDYEQSQQTPEYIRAFENLKQTSSETLNSLLSQFENAKGAAAKVLSPDQLREYTTTIQEIMDELDSRNPFQSLIDKKQELSLAQEELAMAQIELENARQQAEAVKGGAKIETGKSTTFNQKTGKLDYTKSYLSEAKALENVEEKTKDYNKSKDKVVKDNAKVKKSEKDVTKQIEDLSDALSSVGDAIGGPAGEIISLIGDIGNFAMTAISGVKMAADTSAQAISTVEKASVILMIISAAIQIAMKIAEIFGKQEQLSQDTIDSYNSLMDVTDDLISQQKDLLDTIAGVQAVMAREDALKLLNKQIDATRKLGKEYLNTGQSIGSHSYGFRMKEMLEGYKKELKAIGIEWNSIVGSGRMEGLFDLSVEQIKSLKEEVDIWIKLDDSVREYFENIIKSSEGINDVIDQTKEALTGLTLDDARESLKEFLLDTDAAFEDVAGNFEDYMRQAIVKNIIDNTLAKQIKDWYSNFTDAMESDDALTEAERIALQDEYMNIFKQAQEMRDAAMDAAGISPSGSKQNASSGGFETMNQETGSELNGRFTDIQMKAGEIKAESIMQTQELKNLSTKADTLIASNFEIRNIADEIRDIQVGSYLELQQISENTGAIIKPIKQMALDIKELKDKR